VAPPLTLRLAPFEREALDVYAASERVPAERVVLTAVLYYLRERDTGRATWRIPSTRTPGTDGILAVDLGEVTGEKLAREAGAQGVEPEELARHALLFFLADFDSGRVSGRLAQTLRDE
jgi:hypothetical protein